MGSSETRVPKIWCFIIIFLLKLATNWRVSTFFPDCFQTVSIENFLRTTSPGGSLAINQKPSPVRFQGPMDAANALVGWNFRRVSLGLTGSHKIL